MFGKLKQSSGYNPQGIGLGLTICNNILNQYGSELKVKSEYGQGTTFYFMVDFPIKQKITTNSDGNKVSSLGYFDS